MAVPTFLIGVLPTYDQIGIWAPVLLVVLRLVQGLSVAGEYATSVVYAVEQAPPGRRGLIGGWIVSGAILGILLGSAVGSAVNAMLPAEDVAAWGAPEVLELDLEGLRVAMLHDSGASTGRSA